MWLQGKNLVTLLRRAAIFLLVVGYSECESIKSRLEFSNGAYENITFAFNENDGSINEVECGEIVTGIKDAFSQASQYLSDATGGKARFGTLRILVPQTWSLSNCSVLGTSVSPIRAYENYRSADFKITGGHPIALTLPWSDQHKGCGQSAHTVFVPASFLNASSVFTKQEQASILFHEWVKFRYGVFEEYGFLNDPFYPACYNSGGLTYYTNCMTPAPEALTSSGSTSSPTCEQLLQDNEMTLKTSLNNAINRSIMFSPHLQPKTNALCTPENHNRLMTTKQTVVCNRLSTTEVVEQHEDFKTRKNFGPISKVDAPVIQLVQPQFRRKAAYAFVIEDTFVYTEEQTRILLQSIAEFLYFIEPGVGNLLYFLPLDQESMVWGPLAIVTQDQKQRFIDRIKQSLESGRIESNSSTQVTLDLYGKLQGTFDRFSESDWHVVHIASSPSNAAGVVNELKKMDYTVSLVTFGSTSANWLLWNSAPQTRNVLVLPPCSQGANQAACASKVSSTLANYLLQVLGDQQPSRFFQRIVDEVIENSTTREICVPDSGASVKSFLLTFAVSSDDTEIVLQTPSGTCSGITNLHGYEGIKFVDSTVANCDYQPGSWRVTVSDPSTSSLSVRGYLEVNGSYNGLLIYPSYGINLKENVLPVQLNMSVPIHAAVRTTDDLPVSSAIVSAEIMFFNQSGLQKTIFDLKDNGVYPDHTENDGVYSALIRGFSPSEAFHTGSITVITNENSRALKQIDTERFSAALLDARLSTKCCGSTVPVGNSLGLFGSTFYTVVLPAMRTGEAIPFPDSLPPGEITLLERKNSTSTSVTLSFVAPDPGDGGTAVTRYDICAICNDACENLNTTDCPPTDRNTPQDCLIDQNKLSSNLTSCSTMAASIFASTRASSMYAIAGVNSLGQRGRLSKQLFELTTDPGEVGSDEKSCKSLKDGCLPIWVFWTLIGCLAFVLLLFIILLICICFKRSSKQKAKAAAAKTTFVSTPYSAPEKSSNGGLNFSQPTLERRGTDNSVGTKSILRPRDSTGYRTPRRDTGEDNVGFSSFAVPPTPHQQPSLFQNRDEDSDNMPVFFSSADAEAERRRSRYDPRDTQPNQSFRTLPRQSDSAYNFNNSNKIPAGYFSGRTSRGSAGDLNYRGNEYGSPVPTISGGMDDQLSDNSSREPMYATVNRKLRRNQPPRHTDQGNSLRFIPPNYQPPQNSRPTSATFLPPPSKSSSRPQSGISMDSGFVRGATPTQQSRQVRMDHFPSSESETYSEMSRLESLPPGPPPPPPPPPPMPASSSHNARKMQPPPKSPTKDDDTQSENSVENSNTLTRSFARSPSSQNGFSILAQMGSLPDRKTLLKPRQGPPPPPPPRSSGRKFDPSYLTALRTNTDGEKKPKENRNQIQDADPFVETDDNDSDNWDHYDDFQFDPGVSHV